MFLYKLPRQALNLQSFCSNLRFQTWGIAHLLLIALQEGNEDTGNSTSRGIYLEEVHAQGQALTSSWPWDGKVKIQWGPHRVCKLQLPSLCLKHDIQTATLEVRAVGGAGDLEQE